MVRNKWCFKDIKSKSRIYQRADVRRNRYINGSAGYNERGR